MAANYWHAFRRVRTKTGYSRIEADVYMPSAEEAKVPVSEGRIYGYVGRCRRGGFTATSGLRRLVAAAVGSLGWS